MEKETSDSLHRYRLNDAEEAVLLNYREQTGILAKSCLEAGIDPKDAVRYWYKTKLISIDVRTKGKTFEHLKKELIKGMGEHTPKYPKIERKKSKESYCLVLDPADIHIGKLASDYESKDAYNSNLAVKRVLEGVDGILFYVQSFHLDKIVLIIGNDILHTDNSKRSTTSGTPQDTDGQWYDNCLLAKKLYVDVIEKLMLIADVHVVHNVSNHDYMTGWFLAETIKTWFKDSKQVTFDTDMTHRKYFVYHKNLIGTTHGDGAKAHDLPLLMAQECKDWNNTTHRYTYTHHVHHKTSKDYIGVTVESSRSASGTDGWHHRNGYQHNPKAIEAYLHHKTKGQIARFTYTF